MNKLMCALGGALLVATAEAQVVNLGAFGTIEVPVTAGTVSPSGGPYSLVSMTFNWQETGGNAWSNQAAWQLVSSTFVVYSGYHSNGAGTGSSTLPVTGAAWTNLPLNQWFDPSQTTLFLLAIQGGIGPNTTALWSDVTLTFSRRPRPIASSIGLIEPPPTGVSITTVGSTFGTALGLYDDAGNLVASSGGGAGEPAALLDLILSPGMYHLYAGGAGSEFIFDFGATPSAASDGGLLMGRIGTLDIPLTSLGGGQGQWFTFEVVPTPSAAALLAMGLPVLARRRR